jgi:hypothetical protein
MWRSCAGVSSTGVERHGGLGLERAFGDRGGGVGDGGLDQVADQRRGGGATGEQVLDEQRAEADVDDAGDDLLGGQCPR